MNFFLKKFPYDLFCFSSHPLIENRCLRYQMDYTNSQILIFPTFPSIFLPDFLFFFRYFSRFPPPHISANLPYFMADFSTFLSDRGLELGAGALRARTPMLNISL